MKEDYEYDEDEDTYSIYRSIFFSTHSKCPVCGTIGYRNGFCVICDFPDYEDKMTEPE